MSEPFSRQYNFLPPQQLAKWLVSRDYIWQKKLLTADELGRLATDRDVQFSGKEVCQLWELGLIRADLILSEHKLRRSQLLLLEKSSQGYYYADLRLPRTGRQGWNTAISKIRGIPKDITLFFHPYRYYVLYHLQRMLTLPFSKMQMFRADRYVGLLEFWLKEVKRWSSSDKTLERICDWNDIVGLAIAIEPVHYPSITNSYIIRGFVSEAEYHAVVDTHLQDLRAMLGQLSHDEIEAIRRELCVDADRLDRNRHIYILLRLGSHESRDKLQGKIGGATMLREMAELLRRFYEEVNNTELPEEDELGFGWMVPGAKKKLYGSHRLFDNDQRVTMEFFQSLRLDHRVKVRWYVEGDTEWGALSSYFDAFPSARVQVVNLRGRFVESKILSFRDSLITDEKASVFSFISLDADRLDNLRVVRKAAEDDIFCGFIFVSRPDFELANFTVEELAEIAWEAATELGAPTEDRSKLDSLLHKIASGSDFLKEVVRTFPSLVYLSKGTEWGQRLFRYADNHPTMIDGSTRPILEAIGEALLAQEATFLGSRENYRVDPTSGRPVRRFPKNGQ